MVLALEIDLDVLEKAGVPERVDVAREASTLKSWPAFSRRYDSDVVACDPAVAEISIVAMGSPSACSAAVGGKRTTGSPEPGGVTAGAAFCPPSAGSAAEGGPPAGSRGGAAGAAPGAGDPGPPPSWGAAPASAGVDAGWVPAKGERQRSRPASSARRAARKALRPWRRASVRFASGARANDASGRAKVFAA